MKTQSSYEFYNAISFLSDYAANLAERPYQDTADMADTRSACQTIEVVIGRLSIEETLLRRRENEEKEREKAKEPKEEPKTEDEEPF